MRCTRRHRPPSSEHFTCRGHSLLAPSFPPQGPLAHHIHFASPRVQLPRQFADYRAYVIDQNPAFHEGRVTAGTFFVCYCFPCIRNASKLPSRVVRRTDLRRDACSVAASRPRSRTTVSRHFEKHSQISLPGRSELCAPSVTTDNARCFPAGE